MGITLPKCFPDHRLALAQARVTLGFHSTNNGQQGDDTSYRLIPVPSIHSRQDAALNESVMICGSSPLLPPPSHHQHGIRSNATLPTFQPFKPLLIKPKAGPIARSRCSALQSSCLSSPLTPPDLSHPPEPVGKPPPSLNTQALGGTWRPRRMGKAGRSPPTVSPAQLRGTTPASPLGARGRGGRQCSSCLLEAGMQALPRHLCWGSGLCPAPRGHSWLYSVFTAAEQSTG